MQVSVLNNLKNLFYEGQGLESPIEILMKDSKVSKTFATEKIKATSREIGRELSQQKEITDADVKVLKDIFETIFELVSAKQKAFFRLENSETVKEMNDAEVVNFISQGLDHIFRLVLTPFMESFSDDHQNLFKLGSVFEEAAHNYALDARDLSNPHAVAQAVAQEMHQLQEALGFLTIDPRDLLMSLVKPKKASAGQLSNFTSLYFPASNPSKDRAPNKLSELDYQNLSKKAGIEFAYGRDDDFAATLFSISAKYALKLAREELHFQNEEQFVTNASVNFFKTLFGKSATNILKPFVQEAFTEDESLHKVLSDLFFRVGDLIISNEAGSFAADPQVVTTFNQKMHKIYREIFTLPEDSAFKERAPHPYFHPFSNN